MTLPAYTTYRESGVEWLGEVPSHWKTMRFSRVVRIAEGQVDPRIEPYCSMVLIAPNHIEARTGRLLVMETAVEQGADSGKYEVQEGDVVYSKIRPGLAKAVLSPCDGLCSADMYPLRGDGVSGGYLKWLVLSAGFTAWAVLESDRVAMPKINREALNELQLPIPPEREQAAIAAFLDRETARIDALVEEQRRLVELLKEKRQAVISHAVTKGLDPTVPMKDSGVEWLGEVPAHWEMVPLKRDLTFLTSGSRGWADHYADDGALFIRIGNLTRDRIDLDLSDIQRVVIPTGAEGERTRVATGDVLFSITAFLGSVAVVPKDIETAYVSQHVALARPAGRYFLPSWIGYVTLSWLGKTQLEVGGYGGTKVQLSLGDVGDLLISAPPHAEQEAIVKALEDQLARLSSLSAEAEAAIILLQERRAALISAAVTGKIDVRGMVPAEAEAA